MRATRPTYTPEFKADAVAALQRSDRSFRLVAQDLGICTHTLRDWYKRDQMAKKSRTGKPAQARGTSVPVTVLKDESAEDRLARLERENGALRKENESLKMDREILKKAAAFFAKENE